MDSSSLKASALGKLVLSSGLLHSSWSKISELHASTYPNKDSGLGIEVSTEAKYTLVVFAAPPISRKGYYNSASTFLAGSQDRNPFHFLCSGRISSFSVHAPALQLFYSAYEDLSKLKSELLQSEKLVIITGAALGGSVASLFSLWLLETFQPREKRPLCITFGSPLIGDASLQQTLEDSVRDSCFLHVSDIAKNPIKAGFFKPFGTFLICFGTQCICIDDPEAVVELLFGVNADLVGWRDYGKILHRLDQSVLSMVDSRPISMSDDVINRMEERMREKIERADMVNQLKDMKIPMLNIDCYRKISKKDKTCYYDRFKTHTASPFSRDYLDVWIHKNELDNYWKSVVTEIERMPEEETLILKSLFIYSGTMYRRMIEPLDIAEYYLSGREEYRTLGRSHHYVMLEKWFGNELIKSGGSDLSDLLTFDSCFWAEVEEAMIVLNLLKTQKLMRDEVLTRKLACFEEYVWEMIRKREVSPEIFLEKSSFMRWWKGYKEIKGRDGFDSSPSDFTEFMNTRKYESYGLLEDRTGDSLKSFVDKKDKGHKMLVVVLKIHLRNEKEKHKALLTISKIAGVISVSLNGYQRITVIGTMDPVVIVNKLRKYWRVIINSVATKEKIQQKKENSKELSEKQVETSDKGKDGKSVLSGDSGSGSIIATVTSKSIHTALNMSNPNDDWSSFCEFLGTHLPPLNLSDCRAEDVIDFLRIQQASGDVEALVGHLSATCEAYGIKLKENPFRSLAVARFLKEVTRESQCILVFWCNDSHDVDESRFMEKISEELHKREVTPLMYNLSGREDLDTELLDRSSVGIVVLSNSHACSSESLDHLVAIMEHWKAQDFVYFKETHSDTGLEGREEAVQLQYLNPIQADRVHNWKAAMAEIASIYGHERTEGTQVMLAKEVVRNACIRLDLKKSKNVARILAFLNKSQPSDAEIVGLWGMAGIGKTSIAREIYGILAPQYDLCYFLEDFYLTCQKKGLRQMRDDFFSKVFGEISLSISACDIKPSFMRDWSHSKTILVVLDGVNYARDAEAVIGGFSWFSHGHRIILTSRRKQVLLQCKVKEPYEIQSLWEFESFRLCKQYLNGESEVISELMSCSSGIPLSLEVFGSSLSKEHINNKKEHLQWLRRNPPTKIQEAFQRSFSGLDEN